jgi:NAD(P)-dependent dehydrogenase (short-subunit alcohol dehydrogenase family)
MATARAERFSLQDKVALVLGGSSGIGREIALGFQDAGATVVPVGKTKSKVAEVRTSLAARGGAHEGYCADLTDPAQLTGIIRQASPSAKFVTGQSIVVDGGFLAAGLD